MGSGFDSEGSPVAPGAARSPARRPPCAPPLRKRVAPPSGARSAKRVAPPVGTSGGWRTSGGCAHRFNRAGVLPPRRPALMGSGLDSEGSPVTPGAARSPARRPPCGPPCARGWLLPALLPAGAPPSGAGGAFEYQGGGIWSIAVTPAEVDEGDTGTHPVTFTVTRTGADAALAGSVEVVFAVSSSATAGVDFSGATFPVLVELGPGEVEGSIGARRVWRHPPGGG